MGVWSWRCGCLVTWFCYHLIAKPGNKTATPSWPDPCIESIINPTIQCPSMMTSSNGNIFRVTGPLCGEFTGSGEFPTQRPVARSFDVFFDLCLNKPLSKQSWGRWFETLSRSLWRHRNATCIQHTHDSFCITAILRVSGLDNFDLPKILLNISRLRQNGCYFPDNIFECIFLKENAWIPIKISLKFVPKSPINNIPALVQIMAWRRPGNKPLSEAMLVSLPTQICVTQP